MGSPVVLGAKLQVTVCKAAHLPGHTQVSWPGRGHFQGLLSWGRSGPCCPENGAKRGPCLGNSLCTGPSGFRCPSPQHRGHCAVARRGPRGVTVETGSQEPGVCRLIVTRNVLRDRVECLVLSSRRPEDLLPRVRKQPNLGP